MKILLCAEYSESNDYIRLLSEAYRSAGHSVVLGPLNFFHTESVPDIVHLQWPEQFYKTNRYLSTDQAALEILSSRLEWFRSQGAIIVYTVHNLAPHETEDADFEREIYQLFAQSAHLLLHHGSASIELLTDIVGQGADSQHIVVPHGAYPALRLDGMAARKRYRLPSSACVLLNFGLQRSYKGAGFINKAFSSLSDPSFHLFSIGPLSPRPTSLLGKLNHWLLGIYNSFTRSLRSMFFRHTRIWRKIPNNEIDAIMAATDIVVLGHRSGLNSGMLALAASYAKPVVYPDIGNFSEQLDGWVWAEGFVAGNIDSAKSAIEILRKRIADADLAQLRADQEAWLLRHSWEIHVNRIIEFVARRAPAEASGEAS